MFKVKKIIVPQCAKKLVFPILNADILQSMQSKVMKFFPQFLMLVGCKILQLDVKEKQFIFYFFTLCYKNGNFQCFFG